VYAFITIDLALRFCVPPTRLEKPDATHQAGPVSMWSKARVGFVRSCRGSIYDPKQS
jgi:hypothetical protein